MIYGDYNQSFQIHIDKMITTEDEKWVYGAFNLIIDGTFYPGKELHWTINVIVDWLKTLLDKPISDFYMPECETAEPDFLFKEAVISRLGYFYKEPNNILSLKDKENLYPKEIGVKIDLFEIEDTGLEVYFFRGDKKDILVYSFNDEISKVELDIGYLHRVISSIPDIKNTPEAL